jgi:hypothetical protein
MGCEIAQGFLLSRPLPSEAFVAWLAEHQRRPAHLTPVNLAPVVALHRMPRLA